MTAQITLADAMRSRRAQLCMRQEDIAKAGGPARGTVRRMERGLAADYRGLTLASLDKALRWRHGTSAAIVAGIADPDPQTWTSDPVSPPLPATVTPSALTLALAPYVAPAVLAQAVRAVEQLAEVAR